jgi:SAM-dependent methyltransferase
MPRPFDLSTAQTHDFVRRSLPGGALRLLEVGCGRGELALRLRAEGHEVIGVEISEEAARAARAAGVDAREADFLQFEEDPFDAVLFTRSLHHIARLPEAVERAHALLVPGGLLVAEELDVEHVDRPTVAWFYGLQALLAAADALAYDPRTGPGDPLERWEREHRRHGPLHPGRALLAEVERRFELVSVERPPYLYRSFCWKLREGAEGWRLAHEVLAAEERLVRKGALLPVGLRLVGRRKDQGD